MSKKSPRVAVGLPVFNAERYVSLAVDSILAQTCEDFELIICDNASTDGTARICESYAARDPRVKYYRNDRNLGASPNFNRAFALSASEYFKWAPYDDLVAPTFLERCIEVLDRRRDVVLCYTRARVIDGRGAVVADYNPGPDATLPGACDRFRNLILHPEYAVQMLGLIRADTLKRTRLFRSFASADEVLLAELALHGRFEEIPDRLYDYRRHPLQSTREPKQRLRMAFFDTSYANRVVLPKWMYLGACIDVVRRAPADLRTRRCCYGHILRWALVPPNLRALGKDVVLAFDQLIAGRAGAGG